MNKKTLGGIAAAVLGALAIALTAPTEPVPVPVEAPDAGPLDALIRDGLINHPACGPAPEYFCPINARCQMLGADACEPWVK